MTFSNTIEPGRICGLRCYTKFALDILMDCFMNKPNVGDRFIDNSIFVASDNEMQYVEWDDRPILEMNLRRRVSAALRRYAKFNAGFTGVYMGRKVFAEVAPCLSLIVLEKDEEAKKRWPHYYESLKGAPLNPMQIAAVETLLTETEAMKDKLWTADSIRDDLQRGLPYRDIATMCSEQTRAVLKKICKIRGW